MALMKACLGMAITALPHYFYLVRRAQAMNCDSSLKAPPTGLRTRS
jgi:hypothetical protein